MIISGRQPAPDRERRCPPRAGSPARPEPALAVGAAGDGGKRRAFAFSDEHRRELVLGDGNPDYCGSLAQRGAAIVVLRVVGGTGGSPTPRYVGVRGQPLKLYI